MIQVILLDDVQIDHLPSKSMQWHCLECHINFDGPSDRSPKGGCPQCASHSVIDINVRPLTRADLGTRYRDTTGQTYILENGKAHV